MGREIRMGMGMEGWICRESGYGLDANIFYEGMRIGNVCCIKIIVDLVRY